MKPCELRRRTYDARCSRGYITTRGFLQYRDAAGTHTVCGDYVLQMADERTIACVYRWNGSETSGERK